MSCFTPIFLGYHFSLWQGLRTDLVHLLLMICFYNCLTIIPFEHVCWIITMQTVGLRVNKPVLILLVVVAQLELNFVRASINFCRLLCRCKHEFRWLIEFGLKFSSKVRLIRVLCWLLGICNIIEATAWFLTSLFSALLFRSRVCACVFGLGVLGLTRVGSLGFWPVFGRFWEFLFQILNLLLHFYLCVKRQEYIYPFLSRPKISKKHTKIYIKDLERYDK